MFLVATPVLADVVEIPNPLGPNTTISSIIAKITEALKGIAILVGGIMIIVSGIQYMTSAGNEEKATKAKKTMLYTVIGVAIVIAVDFIVGFIQELLGGLK